MEPEQLALDLGLPPPAQPALAPAAPRPAARRRAKPEPFNYTDALWEVVRDLVAALEELRHVDLERILLSISQARQLSTHGVYASCVPLRFEGGARETVIRKRRYRMPELRRGEREILYVIYVMLPRFHEETDYREKLATLIHELYHISPRFDGDIRRFSGKNFAHGRSREHYHAAMRKLADRYLAASPRAESFEFFRTPFSELLDRPGGVVGYCISRPKAILVPEPGPKTVRRRG
jgi:hypothetical protein